MRETKTFNGIHSPHKEVIKSQGWRWPLMMCWGKLGRSNIKSRGPLLWAEKQPNGSIREVLFLSFSRCRSEETENKWKLICIKCLSRRTCPLRDDHAGILHPARRRRGGGDNIGRLCVATISRWQLCLCTCVWVLVLIAHNIGIFL